MSHVCARSWGETGKGWLFCTLPKGHAGTCVNSVTGPKPDGVMYFDEQPSAAEFLAKQREDEAKAIARKAAK